MNNILHKCILSENVPNMIIYGRPFMYQSFIDEYYKINNIDKTHHIRDKNYEHFNYKCSSKHYEIDCENFNKDNRNDFHQLFTSLIETKEYYVNLSHKTIIFYNCDHLKHSLQNTFRVIIEKYRKTCVFIFLCYKINRFIDFWRFEAMRKKLVFLTAFQSTKKTKNRRDERQRGAFPAPRVLQRYRSWRPGSLGRPRARPDRR